MLGAGQWGTWLARRLQTCGFDLLGILGDRASVYALATELSVTSSHEPDVEGAIVWVCVPDAQIETVFSEAEGWKHSPRGLIHASGTQAIVDAVHYASAACWPIQSITADIAPDWQTLPFVIESSSSAFAKTILDLATVLSGLPPKLVTDPLARRRLHLAACLTQNFGNLLYRLAEEVLAKAGQDYRDLLPLLQNHLHKLAKAPPSQLQTGPAARLDLVTLASHRELLAADPQTLALYDTMTALIVERSRS